MKDEEVLQDTIPFAAAIVEFLRDCSNGAGIKLIYNEIHSTWVSVSETREKYERLWSNGQPTYQNEIRGALNYLKNKGIVVRTGRWAEWKLRSDVVCNDS